MTLGRDVELKRPLAPRGLVGASLTESIAVTAPCLLVGATDWCTHPRRPRRRTDRGNQEPSCPMTSLIWRRTWWWPTEEENRPADNRGSHRTAALAVWLTAPTTVREALASLDRMLAGWLWPGASGVVG